MNEEKALLAAICATPEDTTPRLVYADWLEEHRDEAGRERAALIRVQCALAELPGDDPQRPELEMRAEALLVAHEEQWRAEVPVWARKGSVFRRGFVSEVTTGQRTFATKGGGLVRRAPVTTLRLGKVGGRVAEIAACPHLVRVRELHLADVHPGALADLLGCPHLDRLRGLHLGGFDGLAHLMARLTPLLESSLMPTLTALSVHNYQLSDTDLARLLSFPALSRLERLKLSNNVVSDREVAVLAQTASLAGLRELDLGGSWYLSDIGLRELVSSPHLTNLTRLELGGAQRVKDEGMRMLADSPYLGNLTDLGLSFTGITDVGLEVLVASRKLSRLASIDLFHAKVDEQRWKPWRSFRPPNLYTRCLWVQRLR